MIQPFSLPPTGSLRFNVSITETLMQELDHIPSSRIALVSSRSCTTMKWFSDTCDALKKSARYVSIHTVTGEPTIEVVDTLATIVSKEDVDMVVGIGGGSVLDSAKALSVLCNMYRTDGKLNSVKYYLEGVGDLDPPYGRLPLILIPTTAGTGSEATTNAVISEIGPQGFKKSLRHESYVPDVVIIDPSLALSLPFSPTMSSALDALSQLFEAYTSVNANPCSDALSLDALYYAKRGIERLASQELENLAARTDMAYAAYMSGIAISQAGLGYIHALAGPLGALHSIGHGNACGLFIAPVAKAMLAKALKHRDEYHYFLSQMERLSHLWGYVDVQDVVTFLEEISRKAMLSPLSNFGFTEDELIHLSRTCNRRGSPVPLEEKELAHILLSV